MSEEDQDEEQSQYVNVYGDKQAKERSSTFPAYVRTIHTRPVTFMCIKCNKTVTQQRYPGRTPLYCSESCTGEAEREQTAERTRRYRERKAARLKLSENEV